MRTPGFVILMIVLLGLGLEAQKKNKKPSAHSPCAGIVSVKHPGQTLFRVDKRGLPILSEAGYLALADSTQYSDYWTHVERKRNPGEARIDRAYGIENWGQIDAFASLHRGLVGYSKLNPGALPVRIHHISGPYGGFPDLNGRGISSHLSHQTGQQFNVMIVPASAKYGRVRSDQKPALWDPHATRRLVASLLDAGAWSLVTHGDTALLQNLKGKSALNGFPPQPTEVTTNGRYHFDPLGRLILFLKGKGNHSDHINVLFWPTGQKVGLAPSGVTIVDASPKTNAEGKRKTRVIEFKCPKAQGSVHINGRYIGESLPQRPLKAEFADGTYQVRVTSRDHIDHLSWMRISAQAEKKVGYLPLKPVDNSFAGIEVGQIVRGVVQSQAIKDSHVYRFRAQAGTKRSVIIYGEGSDVDVYAISPKGKSVERTPVVWVSGLPRLFTRLQWTVKESGEWRIAIVPKKNVPTPYIVGLEKSLPDFYKAEGQPPSRFKVPGKPEKN